MVPTFAESYRSRTYRKFKLARSIIVTFSSQKCNAQQQRQNCYNLHLTTQSLYLLAPKHTRIVAKLLAAFKASVCAKEVFEFLLLTGVSERF